VRSTSGWVGHTGWQRVGCMVLSLTWRLKQSLLQIRILSKCTGNTADKLEKDISRPRYFDPYDAIKYGIIDKVFYAPCLLPLCISLQCLWGQRRQNLHTSALTSLYLVHFTNPYKTFHGDQEKGGGSDSRCLSPMPCAESVTRALVFVTYPAHIHTSCKSVEVYKGQVNTNTTMSFTLSYPVLLAAAVDLFCALAAGSGARQ